MIFLTEILTVDQRLYAQEFLVMETLPAGLYYVLIVSVFGGLLRRLEAYLDLSQRKPQTLAQPALEQLQASLRSRPASVRPASTAGAAPALQLQNVHKSYGDHEVLKGIDLRIRTILDNITLAPRYHGQARDLSEQRAYALLAHAAKYPHQLSGG